jgi:hypothetical protein
MSIKPEHATILASMVMKEVRAEVMTVNTTPQFLGIWPVASSEGPRPVGVMIRPQKDLYMAVDAEANTIGCHAAFLAADTEYAFPIHPKVNTLSFIDADSQADNNTFIRWIFS